MKSLADLLDFVVSTLETWRLCAHVQVWETEQFSNDRFVLKVRAELNTGDRLQIRLYQNGAHIDYAYQLFDDNEPGIRWDNKEHFSGLASYPHHFHVTLEKIEPSPLNGDPAHDLPIVLKYIESR